MRGWWWLLGLLLVWIVAEGFLFKLHEAGVLDALERWRERPRAVVITLAEIALLLTVSGFFVTTSGWAAVAWFAAGLLAAALLAWTTHLILRAPDLGTGTPVPASAEPETVGPRPPIRQAYIWVRSPGAQLLMHAVPVTAGAPEPRAYCGCEYDPGEIPPPGTAMFWCPEKQPPSLTCATCRAALVKAG
jgi:hypothetical protein